MNKYKVTIENIPDDFRTDYVFPNKVEFVVNGDITVEQFIEHFLKALDLMAGFPVGDWLGKLDGED